MKTKNYYTLTPKSCSSLDNLLKIWTGNELKVRIWYNLPRVYNQDDQRQWHPYLKEKEKKINNLIKNRNWWECRVWWDTKQTEGVRLRLRSGLLTKFPLTIIPLNWVSEVYLGKKRIMSTHCSRRFIRHRNNKWLFK